MKYVAFLRGINVGKTKLIPMLELKNLFLDIGFDSPKTYFRSGNVVFDYNNKNNNINKNNKDDDINVNDELNSEKIANIISKNIEKVFGFDVVAIVKNKNYIDHLFENNNYKEDNSIEELYVTIFKDEINDLLSKKLINDSANIDTDDEFIISGDKIYLLCKSKYHKTKFNNNYFESKLDNVATTRNWKTISKIKDMMGN